MMAESVFLWGEESMFPAYAAALRACGATAVFSRDLAQSDACGALLLCGGGDIHPHRYGAEMEHCRDVDEVRDAAEWELAERFSKTGRPILGICRGMQLLNVFFGGTLCQHIDGHGRHEDGRERTHGVRAADGSPFACWWGDRFEVNSSHHQAVEKLAGTLRPLLWAEDGVVEAFSHGMLPVLGVQWHPERQTGEGREARLVDGLPVFRYFLSLGEWETA